LTISQLKQLTSFILANNFKKDKHRFSKATLDTWTDAGQQQQEQEQRPDKDHINVAYTALFDLNEDLKWTEHDINECSSATNKIFSDIGFELTNTQRAIAAIAYLNSESQRR